MQNTAMAWYVYTTTGSEFWTGVVVALPMVITLALILFGGAVADHFDKRKLFIWSQALGMFQAFALGILILINCLPLWLIIFLTALLGLVGAVETPIRQSYFSDLVEEKDIGAAASLNTTLSTAALTIGPGISGLLMAKVGIEWTFIINGISFLAVIITLLMIHVDKLVEKKPLPSWQTLKSMFLEGCYYTKHNNKISLGIFLGGVVMMFGYSSYAIMPSVSRKVFDSGPMVLGLLNAARGLGALSGSLFVSARVKGKISFKNFVLSGMLLTGSTVVLFSFTSNLAIACCLLLLSGVGMTLVVSTSRAELMTQTDKSMRGRVASITMLVFLLGMSMGNFLAGIIAEKINIMTALLSSGLGMLVMAVIAFFVIDQVYLSKPVAKKILV